MTIKRTSLLLSILLLTSCGKVSTTPPATGTSSETPSVPVTSTPTPAASQNTTAVAPQSPQNQVLSSQDTPPNDSPIQNEGVGGGGGTQQPKAQKTTVYVGKSNTQIKLYDPCEEDPNDKHCLPRNKLETAEDIQKTSLPEPPASRKAKSEGDLQ